MPIPGVGVKKNPTAYTCISEVVLRYIHARENELITTLSMGSYG